ncbi:glycosyltransferase family 2 protein [Metabacillus idriensis]|uniref:Glycosyltransferase n=1 Tax=Metabacillus idriensis TaxID=324768 RepID=A0A6I2M7M0_9BACI|nr:glycosyltransferase family 2 protein [Metabacillus idriensis]MCM3595758.1 glycosyltransferase family 2 protein [Metabacillus idriensis]MRX53869.1 glycosyltransferase [Metabacillus idriensis]
MNAPTLTIVVPCYNEEEILPHTIHNLSQVLENLVTEKKVSLKSRVLFIDDGSKDSTWSIINKACLHMERVAGLKLSRNAGHQNALLAGMFTAQEGSDCIITIDADLQDDVTVIYEFIDTYQKGFEIVYGVRKKRGTDTLFKRKSAEWFYKIMKKLGVELIYNHADYRLMSKRAVQELKGFDEANLFLRGIVPLIGFRSAKVYYDRKERLAGQTKYPLSKMLSFAFDGITSFSVTPIRFVLSMGLITFLVSLLFSIYCLTMKYLGRTQTGWTSLIASIWLIGGLQMIATGLVGEYIGKVYKETKRRPKYIVDIDLFNLPIQKNNIQEEDFRYELRK